MLQVASVVSHHLRVRRHHQLHVAGVGQEALASAVSPVGVGGGGAGGGGGVAACVGVGVWAGVGVLIAYGAADRLQLLRHVPVVLQNDRPGRLVLCLGNKKYIFVSTPCGDRLQHLPLRET